MAKIGKYFICTENEILWAVRGGEAHILDREVRKICRDIEVLLHVRKA